MLKQLTMYFDKMASVIKMVDDLSEWTEKDFVSVLENENNKYYNALFEYVPSMQRMELNGFTIYMLDDNFFESVDKFIATYKDDISMLLLLLYYMDRRIANCYDSSFNFTEDAMEIDALNLNVKDTGIMLFRRVKCSWRVSVKQDNLNNTILDYFYYVNVKEIDGTIIRNFLLDPNIILDTDKEYLKIAISPITKDVVAQFTEKPYTKTNSRTDEEQYYFRVENIIEEEIIANSVFDLILSAGDQDVDILVFPEMLGNDNML